MLLLSTPVLLLLLLLLPAAAAVVASLHWHAVSLLLGVAAVVLHIVGGGGELRGAEYVSPVWLLITSLVIALLLPRGCLHAMHVGVNGRSSIWAFDICQPHLQKLAFHSELI
jgi:hypothetical protein